MKNIRNRRVKTKISFASRVGRWYIAAAFCSRLMDVYTILLIQIMVAGGTHIVAKAVVAVFANSQPIFAAILATIFLDYSISTNFVVGGLMTITGVLITQLGETRKDDSLKSSFLFLLLLLSSIGWITNRFRISRVRSLCLGSSSV